MRMEEYEEDGVEVKAKRIDNLRHGAARLRFPPTRHQAAQFLIRDTRHVSLV